MTDLAAIVDKLCQASERDFYNPGTFDWPESVQMEDWFTSPELISIYGMPAYDTMSEQNRRRLSFFEAINFFSLNIHGEKSLVEGLAKRLYAKNTKVVSPYLHHFLDEENKHMMYFGGFCTRYAGKVYPDRKMAFERDYAPGEEDFLFFVKVMIFEEIVDYYNVKMGVDDRLNSVARFINMMHHKDEARHLVFGRKVVTELFAQHSPTWSALTLQSVRDYINGYLEATWKEYYNPAVYKDAGLADVCKDAGLADVYDLQKAAIAHPSSKAHRKKVSGSCVAFLLKNGILLEEPSL
jgi:hypothetical protein